MLSGVEKLCRTISVLNPGNKGCGIFQPVHYDPLHNVHLSNNDCPCRSGGLTRVVIPSECHHSKFHFVFQLIRVWTYRRNS